MEEGRGKESIIPMKRAKAAVRANQKLLRRVMRENEGLGGEMEDLGY